MCPRPDMYRTRPRHVLDVSSKCPSPDYFGTSPNRTSETKGDIKCGVPRRYIGVFYIQHLTKMRRNLLKYQNKPFG